MSRLRRSLVGSQFQLRLGSEQVFLGGALEATAFEAGFAIEAGTRKATPSLRGLEVHPAFKRGRPRPAYPRAGLVSVSRAVFSHRGATH